MSSKEIGIVETREIVKSIEINYNYDFKDYALTSLKHSLERIMEIHNVNSSDNLILRLKDNPDFLGPAILVQAYRFLADSRDKGFDDRLPLLDQPDGVWSCRNHFQCTRACPRGIKITKRINQTKNMIKKYCESEGK